MKGDLDKEIVVVSTSEIRTADRLIVDTPLHTADGLVVGRAGDFAITTAAHERYPILSATFLGTYRILGTIGTRYVCRRLLHARRAWPVLSPHAELNYGADRGTVAGIRGGWIYQSDDNDFGFINMEQSTKGHVVVGTAHELQAADWESRYRNTTLALTVLPPILTALGLLAFVAVTVYSNLRIAAALLLIEAALLLGGMTMGRWMKRKHVALRAALCLTNHIAREFQVAAELLGQKSSELFPGMVLWRATQDDAAAPRTFQPGQFRKLKEHLSEACDRAQRDMDRYRRAEEGFSICAAVTAVIILACVLYLVLMEHSWPVEAFALWLPSLIGTLHALSFRRAIALRVAAGREFLAELIFARKQIYALVPNNENVPQEPTVNADLVATLRMLCRVLGEHTQRELTHALGEDPSLPV